jgi:hypothetical protein
MRTNQPNSQPSQPSQTARVLLTLAALANLTLACAPENAAAWQVVANGLAGVAQQAGQPTYTRPLPQQPSCTYAGCPLGQQCITASSGESMCATQVGAYGQTIYTPPGPANCLVTGCSIGSYCSSTYHRCIRL